MIKAKIKIYILTLMLACGSLNSKSIAATQVTLISGLFSRTIDVYEIDYLAKNKKANGRLKIIMKNLKQDPVKISNLLNEKIELPIVLTSNLMNSKIGEVILGRISKIMHPIRIENTKIAIPAFRAGVINGLQLEKGNLTLINFIKAYPNKNLAININALFKIVDKVESISELVKFFSNSPLEKLRDPSEGIKFNNEEQ